MVVDCFALGYTRTFMFLTNPSTFLFFLANARLAPTFLFPLLSMLTSTSTLACDTLSQLSGWGRRGSCVVLWENQVVLGKAEEGTASASLGSHSLSGKVKWINKM